MDNYINIGKIINTFGIKSEVKVKSDFEYKDRVFKKGFSLFVGVNKDKEIINTYRVHKNYDLITFVGYSNINEILKYKGNNIYILRSDLNLKDDEYLYSDLIGFKVLEDNKELGIVLDYELNYNNVLLKIKGEKEFYIPLVEEYIINVDLKNRLIITKNGSDLIL